MFLLVNNYLWTTHFHWTSYKMACSYSTLCFMNGWDGHFSARVTMKLYYILLSYPRANISTGVEWHCWIFENSFTFYQHVLKGTYTSFIRNIFCHTAGKMFRARPWPVSTSLGVRHRQLCAEKMMVMEPKRKLLTIRQLLIRRQLSSEYQLFLFWFHHHLLDIMEPAFTCWDSIRPKTGRGLIRPKHCAWTNASRRLSLKGYPPSVLVF